MRVLLLDGYASDDADRLVVAAAREALQASGHRVDMLELHGFNPVMSAEEHAAYNSGAPVVSSDVEDSVARLRKTQAMLFCYPTIAFAVPAVVKGWIDRVLVPGVAFVFDDRHRIRPGMPGIRRVGAVTTSPHGRVARLRARDTGKRTAVRNMRLSCHSRCRTTYLPLPTPAGRAEENKIRRTLSRW